MDEHSGPTHIKLNHEALVQDHQRKTANDELLDMQLPVLINRVWLGTLPG